MREPVDVNTLAADVDRIHWFHRIDLGNGLVTKGDDDTPAKLRTIGLPDRLDGLSVLDVGAWDGFFSFEAERRGAARVLATDHFCWSGPGWGTKAGFDLAHRALESRVESRDIDVMDISPQTVGTFDLVLFLGVLYHLRHPLLALEKIFSVTRRQLILETGVDLVFYPHPAMAFYPGSEAADDATNWWGPNPSAVEAMLKSVGFSRVRKYWQQPLRQTVARSAVQSLKKRRLFQISRVVYHAYP
jgi:tRNA (mo5U34)-methyltransferase